MDGSALLERVVPLSSHGVDVPWFPTLVALAGVGVFLLFTIQAFRPGTLQREVERPSPAAPAAPPAAPAAPTPPPTKPTYKRAPFSVHFPQIPAGYPDVWGVREAVDIVIRPDERALAASGAVRGVTVTVDGQPVTAAFQRGAVALRRVFPAAGEKTIAVEHHAPNEAQPRRTERVLKVVEYRAEIAEVFTNFREEASRTIVPIRPDATPWEIYDLITEASPKIPGARLREIITCFEEAKYSNHAVTRATYERMISALLELERLEL